MAPHVLESCDGSTPSDRPRRLYSIDGLPTVAKLDSICSRVASAKDHPLAVRVEKNIPVYDLATLPTDSDSVDAVLDEWYNILADGPGVFVVKSFYTDMALLDAVNAAFHSIIECEKSNPKGDHFAPGGKNDRIWNSFSKLCLHDPAAFVAYYSNPWLCNICTAWLGPQYRITAQTNIVKPGGAAQTSHRDYHLGFQSAEACAAFPRSIQHASQFLTLQGAVAHTPMPLDSGPTRFLPFSQSLPAGYMAFRLPEFDDYFTRHWVSVALEKGDAVFFNPALHHAAGTNTSTSDRSANLLQISSAFGKPMESVDAIPLIQKCWPHVQALHQRQGSAAEVNALIAAVGEGYCFPTNLDRRPPQPNGMAPASEQEVLRCAVEAGWGVERVVEAMRRMRVDAEA